MTRHFYHGSTKFFTALKPNSLVSIQREEARINATPWAITGVEDASGESLLGGDSLPEDSPLFIYKISTEKVRPVEGDRGKIWEWNWETLDWENVELVEYYPSWYRLFGIHSNYLNKNLEKKFEESKAF